MYQPEITQDLIDGFRERCAINQPMGGGHGFAKLTDVLVADMPTMTHEQLNALCTEIAWATETLFRAKLLLDEFEGVGPEAPMSPFKDALHATAVLVLRLRDRIEVELMQLQVNAKQARKILK